MDNYGNDMYLSHPSIDFTLLDRPSGSIISARESVAPFPQGDSSFRSLNLFNGAESVPYNNQSIADHGSYAVEAHKNVMERHASGGFVLLPNQSKSVHNFFEQGNQPGKSDSGVWPRDKQSPHYLPRVASAEESVQIRLYQKNSYEASSQRNNSEQANTESRMPPTSVGFLKSMSGEPIHSSSLMNVSLSMQKEFRNQALTSQGVLNLPPSNNFGSGSSAGVPSYHPAINNMSDFGSQYQNQAENYDVSSQTGVVFEHAPSYNFLGNQVPWKGAIQHPQVVVSKPLRGFMRAAEPSELQSQQQLRESLLADHVKQPEDSRKEQLFQQPPNHFSRTSYSDLLHGPDTPPSQQQTTEEYEIRASVLPSENAEGVGWPVDGPLCYKGVISDWGLEQNQNSSLQMPLFVETVNSGRQLGNLKDQNGPPLASYTAGQVVPEQIDGRWKSSSLHQTGKPAPETFHSGIRHLTDVRTRELGLRNDWNSDTRKNNHLLSKLNTAQYPSDESYLKLKGGDLTQVNAFSQSQQHFQELQFAEQRNLTSEPRHLISSPNVSLPLRLNSPKSRLKNGMQQRSNSFTTMNNVVGYMPHNLPGIPSDSFVASGQPQWLTSSLSGSPSRPTAAEAGDQHQANSWEGLQAPQPSRGTGFNLESAPEKIYNAVGNCNPQQLSQQGSPMMGILPRPFDASDIRQQGLYNTQVIAMNARTNVAGSGSVPNQKISMSLHDCRKEGGGANVSNDRVQPLSEPVSQFQGAWKKYTPMQFPPEGGSLSQQSLDDGLRPQHCFEHQGYLNSEASFHTPEKANNPMNPSVQFVSNQLVHEGQFSVKNTRLLEKHINQEQTASLPTANLMKTVNRHAMKLVPDAMEESQGGLYKFVEPQDVFLERQREVPQQQLNSCTESVSLAHLRGNQSSSSLSPQHFRLGLGPSQDSQHPTDASWRNFSNQQSLSGEVPTLKSAHKTLSAESPRAGFETARKDEIELNQGSSGSMNRMVLQSSGTSPSFFTNRPPPGLRDMASSDNSPTSSFVSGRVRGGNSLLPASTSSYSNEYNIGHEPIQTRDKAGGATSSGFLQIQTNASNCASHQDAANGYSGKSSCISNYSRLPDHSAGAPPMQKKHLIDRSTLDKDGIGTNAMQDHNLNIISARQVGNRSNVLDSKGLATVSKGSVLEYPKTIVNNEQEFSGILESSRMPSSSARGVSGGDQKRETMQRSPVMLRNQNNWRVEEQSFQTSSMQYNFNDQLNAYRVTQFGNEKNGLMSSTSSPNIQGEMHQLSTSVDGSSSHSVQAWRPSQDANRYQPAKSLDSNVSETKAFGRNTRKPPLRAPSPSAIRPGMQPPIYEDLGQRQNFRGLEPSARVERSPESANLPLTESNKLSSNSGKNSAEPMYAGMWSTNQHAKNVQLLAADPVSMLDALQQHNASVSESKSQDISQPVGISEHLQLQKDSSKFHPPVPNPTSFNHHCLPSAGFEHTSVQASEKPLLLQQVSSGNKEIKVIASDKQVPLGFDSSTMKEEVVTAPMQGPVSMPKNEGQLSPLRAITPGEVAPPSKKRKKQLPLLIPWHIAVAQPNMNLPSTSDAEVMWATVLNRVAEKVFNATHEDNTSSVSRAKRRLTLTTESVQQLFPPLLDVLMHGRTPAERECGIYSLAKCELEDACRLVAKSKDQAELMETSPSSMNITSSHEQACGIAKNNELTKCVESFMERVKHLGMELARLDCSTSVSELQGETHELEKLSIVNRLAKHHGIGFTMDSSDRLLIENIFEFGVGARKPPAQRYVTATAMPRTLPEGVRCLSL